MITRAVAYVGTVCAALTLCGVSAAQDGVSDFTVPSGRVVQLYETVLPEDSGGLLYLGFLAPFIADGGVAFEEVSDDMDALCAEVGLRSAQGSDAQIEEVVIRLMAAPVPYGATDPAVTQYVNFFDVTSGECAWM